MFLRVYCLLFLTVGCFGLSLITPEAELVVKKYLNLECMQHASPQELTVARTATEDFLKCLRTHMSTTFEDIVLARHNNTVRETFKMHCDNSFKLTQCAKDFGEKVAPCHKEDMRKAIPIIIRGVEELIGFLCREHGHALAVFIKERGPECIESKLLELAMCLHQWKDKRGLINTLQTLNMEKICAKFDAFDKCVLDEMAQCGPSPAPVNLVAALFRNIRSLGPCSNRPSVN